MSRETKNRSQKKEETHFFVSSSIFPLSLYLSESILFSFWIIYFELSCFYPFSLRYLFLSLAFLIFTTPTLIHIRKYTNTVHTHTHNMHLYMHVYLSVYPPTINFVVFVVFFSTPETNEEQNEEKVNRKCNTIQLKTFGSFIHFPTWWIRIIKAINSWLFLFLLVLTSTTFVCMVVQWFFVPVVSFE